MLVQDRLLTDQRSVERLKILTRPWCCHAEWVTLTIVRGVTIFVIFSDGTTIFGSLLLSKTTDMSSCFVGCSWNCGILDCSAHAFLDVVTSRPYIFLCEGFDEVILSNALAI